MQCPQRQHENREGLKFCNQCGTSLSLQCAQGGFTNDPGSRFCGECGAPLSQQHPATSPAQSAAPVATEPERKPLSYPPQYLAEKILTSRSVLEGERKVVTVLFADIKDSTELIKDLTVFFSAVAPLLGSAYALVRRVARALQTMEQIDTVGQGFGLLRPTVVEQACASAISQIQASMLNAPLHCLVNINSEGPRHGAFVFSAILPYIAIPQKSSRPTPTTNKPLSWPTNSACVPSRRTATVALASCITKPDSQNKPVPNCPLLSRCTETWR
jgi:hypothetical protein